MRSLFFYSREDKVVIDEVRYESKAKTFLQSVFSYFLMIGAIFALWHWYPQIDAYLSRDACFDPEELTLSIQKSCFAVHDILDAKDAAAAENAGTSDYELAWAVSARMAVLQGWYGRLEAAVDQLKVARDKQTARNELYRVHVMREADFLNRLGRVDEALELLKGSKSPEGPHSFYRYYKTYIWTLIATGQMQEALALQDRLLRLSDQDEDRRAVVEALSSWTNANVALAFGRYEEVIAALEHPSNLEFAWLEEGCLYGKALSSMGRHFQAKKWFEDLVDVASTREDQSIWVFSHLAQIGALRQAGEVELAAHYASEQLELPKRRSQGIREDYPFPISLDLGGTRDLIAAFHHFFAEILVADGRYDQAAAALFKAATLSPSLRDTYTSHLERLSLLEDPTALGKWTDTLESALASCLPQGCFPMRSPPCFQEPAPYCAHRLW